VKRPPAIVFDLDGTLVDSIPDIVDTFRATFAEVGLVAPDGEQVRAAVGLPLEQMYAAHAPDELVPRLVEAYRELYQEGFARASKCGAITITQGRCVGGAVVGEMTLNIPFWTFLDRIHDVVPQHDLWVGLIKAPVFGLIVGLAGCYHGMQVRGDSEEVGRRTTMAVVSAIFAVIVLDAFFAVFFTEVGWG
jgi:hypothetical protein